MISDIINLISPAVKKHLIDHGVNWESFTNWLRALQKLLRLNDPTFNRYMAEVGGDTQAEVWSNAIRWSREGRLAGAASAELLLAFVAILLVGFLFYTGGRRIGDVTVNEILDVNGRVADQEAFNSLLRLLDKAIASGRWRLKPGWNRRDAMLKLLINFRTNYPPGFSEILEPVAVDDGPVSVSGPGSVTGR